jgi:RNA polymerase subunit RPABC4/transcription elongation factor Spt4
MRRKYTCPSCKKKSYSKHWNAETSKKYGVNGEILLIQEEENNSYYICPECKQESEMFKGQLIIDSTEPAQAEG